MGQRLDLQFDLEELMGGHMVKFQPPPSYKLSYPCIVYSMSAGRSRFAGNMPYTFTRRYMVTLIDRNPDSVYVEKLAMAFPMIVLDRTYTAEGLHHWVYTLYY